MTATRELCLFLESVGAREISVAPPRGHGHPQLSFQYRGQYHRTGICCTPGDVNSARIKIADLRRMMGLAWHPARKGERRTARRKCRQARPAECPRLTALPDRWRPALEAMLAAMLAERDEERMAA